MNFLRDGEKAVLPSQEDILQQLLVEVDFYHLQPLADIITDKLTSLEKSRHQDVSKGVLRLVADKLGSYTYDYTSDDGRKFRVIRSTKASHDWLGVDLSFTVFRNIQFYYQWNFSSCTMKGCRFIDCTFESYKGNILFQNSDLTDAVFERCRNVPVCCDFGGAILNNAKFHKDWKPCTNL